MNCLPYLFTVNCNITSINRVWLTSSLMGKSNCPYNFWYVNDSSQSYWQYFFIAIILFQLCFSSSDCNSQIGCQKFQEKADEAAAIIFVLSKAYTSSGRCLQQVCLKFYLKILICFTVYNGKLMLCLCIWKSLT